MLKFRKKSLALRNILKLPGIGGILLFAFALRLMWYLYVLYNHPEGFWLYDSNEYWNLAYNMDEHGVFSSQAEAPLYLNYYRTPLYPLFILPTVWFDYTGNSIAFFQIFLQLVNIYLVYLIIRLLTKNEKYARWGAFIFAVDICSIVFGNFVLTETLFALLLTTSVYFFVRAMMNAHWKHFAFCGLFCGLAILCRPVAFFIPWLLGGFILFRYGIKSGLAYKTLFLFTAIVLLVQYPWLERNNRLNGHYFNSVIGEHDLLGLHASVVYSEVHAMNLQDAQDELRWQCFRQVEYDVEKHPYEYAKLVQAHALKIISDHPGIFLKHHIKNVIYFFAKPARTYASVQLGIKPGHIIVYILILFQIILLLFFYPGIILLLWRRKTIPAFNIFILLMLMVFIFANLNVPPYTDARMRVVIHPLLIVLATAGWMYWIENRRKKAAVDRIS